MSVAELASIPALPEALPPAPQWSRLDRAAALLSESGDREAAGAVARTALHRSLIRAVECTGGIPAKVHRKNTLVRVLIARGILDADDHPKLRRLFRIGNAAAHGAWTTASQTLELIEAVRELANRLPR